MKVLDLSCTHAHHFEGWFASEDAFQEQLAQDLVSCPLCGDTQVVKKLSAPRLNLSSARSSDKLLANAASEVATDLPTHSPSIEADQMQTAWMKMVRHVISNTEDVGEQFPTEARKMHYGDAQHRNIRGKATPEETQELMEEGISVLPLPVPEVLKETLQ